MALQSAGASPPTASQEWRANWTLVLAAMAGLSFGSMPAATLGLFMAPLEDEFGWSRAMVSAGMMVFAAFAVLLTPFAGALVDRFGARRCAIPGLALTGLSFAAFSLMTGASMMWWGIWVAYSVFSLFIRSMVWNSAVSNAFNTSRGLAIAIVLSGLAITQVIAPPLALVLIDGFGWRAAYAALGVGWAGTALVLVIFFFRTRSDAASARDTGGEAAAARVLPGGLTLKQAFRSWAVIRVALAIFLSTLMGAAIAIHIVPILVSEGISRAEAASLAAFLGASSFAGNLLTGWLVDRISGGLLPFAVFSLPALGFLLIWQAGAGIPLLALGVLCIGYGTGAGLQMATYLTTRYAGMRNFGKIFGVISSLIGLSGGLGPLLSGWIFDMTGAYDLALAAGIPALVLAGLRVLGLGPYPRFDDEPARAAE